MWCSINQTYAGTSMALTLEDFIHDWGNFFECRNAWESDIEFSAIITDIIQKDYMHIQLECLVWLVTRKSS